MENASHRARGRERDEQDKRYVLSSTLHAMGSRVNRSPSGQLQKDARGWVSPPDLSKNHVILRGEVREDVGRVLPAADGIVSTTVAPRRWELPPARWILRSRAIFSNEGRFDGTRSQLVWMTSTR